MRELAGNLAGDGAAWLSRAVHTEVALLHCLEAVQHLPVPNRFRTECVCQLFDRLAAGLGRHEPLLRELQGELFASIYEGFKPVAGGCVKGKAWFEVAQALQAQVDAAQRERREWHAERTELRRRLNALLASEDSGSTLVKALVFEGLKRQALRRQHDETARQNERLVDACIAHADELAHAKQACLSMTVRTVVLRRQLNRARAEAKRLEELMAGAAPRRAAGGGGGGGGGEGGGGDARRLEELEELEALREEVAGLRERERKSNLLRGRQQEYAAENAALAVRAEAAEKLAAEKAEAAENLQARLEELTKAASDAAAARRQQLAVAAV